MYHLISDQATQKQGCENDGEPHSKSFNKVLIHRMLITRKIAYLKPTATWSSSITMQHFKLLFNLRDLALELGSCLIPDTLLRNLAAFPQHERGESKYP